MNGVFAMRSGGVAALFMILLALASCGKKEEKADDTPIVDVCGVSGMDGSGELSFTGKTKSSGDVNLAFRVSGQIARVLVSEGDYVRKGQVVAEMDSRDYQLQLEATQAEYEGIKADAERVMALYAEGNTTASNYDKARYGLQQITQKLANHRNQLSDTKLRSTIDGYVATKLHESGETVGAGMPVVSLFGSGGTEVEIKISATDFANIDKLTNFYCKFDVTGDEQFPLTIARKSQEANSSQLYAIRLRFVNSLSGKKITPGMSTIVHADMLTEEGGGEMSIPSTALLNKDDKVYVFVYDEASGTVRQTAVMVSALHRNGTADVTSGLKRTDKVVCTGVHHIADGQKVKLLQKPSQSNVGGLL